MADVIDRFNHDQWVSDLTMQYARLDVQRVEEQMAESEIIAYSKDFGLELWDLVDVCFHDWYDMEDPIHFLRFYGPDAYDYEIVPKPPARWLLRSTWLLRQRGIDKLTKASQDA